MSANLSARARAQLAIVEEHVSRENAHDLPGIMATFGQTAWYADEPWGEHHDGRDAVRGYYRASDHGGAGLWAKALRVWLICAGGRLIVDAFNQAASPQFSRDKTAQQCPCEAGAPSGQDVSWKVDPHVDATDADQERQEKGDAEEVDFQAPLPAEAGQQ